MPIWFELIALLLLAYGAGIGLGWAFWTRAHWRETREEEGDSEWSN